MLFLLNFAALVATLLMLVQLGFASVSVIERLQEKLKAEERAQWLVMKCASHLANKKNIEVAYSYLLKHYPQKKALLSQRFHQYLLKNQSWQETLNCSGNHYSLKETLRLNDNPHLHPLWPNWVPSFQQFGESGENS